MLANPFSADESGLQFTPNWAVSKVLRRRARAIAGHHFGSRRFSIFTSTVYSGSTIWMMGARAFCDTNW